MTSSELGAWSLELGAWSLELSVWSLELIEVNAFTDIWARTFVIA